MGNCPFFISLYLLQSPQMIFSQLLLNRLAVQQVLLNFGLYLQFMSSIQLLYSVEHVLSKRESFFVLIL